MVAVMFIRKSLLKCDAMNNAIVKYIICFIIVALPFVGYSQVISNSASETSFKNEITMSIGTSMPIAHGISSLGHNEDLSFTRFLGTSRLGFVVGLKYKHHIISDVPLATGESLRRAYYAHKLYWGLAYEIAPLKKMRFEVRLMRGRAFLYDVNPKRPHTGIYHVPMYYRSVFMTSLRFKYSVCNWAGFFLEGSFNIPCLSTPLPIDNYDFDEYYSTDYIAYCSFDIKLGISFRF